ncbi:Pentatricopeptide repeat-containing protein [Apostasia shenzhenica]|uniref:Pentatricopeptide repeat-containing protein n=1 Tax=Apostasia shenzhenica TaxID=1088818 RepID=A0A2H9ZRP4_9ASPA|nr:Pentatricopeptide repeat-containing protein [Apostasia shenzhenica]
MDVHMLSALLTACIASKSLARGRLLHSKAIFLGLQYNINFCKSLTNFYIFFHLFDHAELILKTIENQSEISIWNSLIAAYSKNQMHKEALELYDKLVLFANVKPDCYTYPSALRACGGSSNAGKGQVIHAHLLKSGFSTDVVALSSLVSMYGKCGFFDFAVKLFEEMPERDVACWNTIISCYYQDGKASTALNMFEKMKSSGFCPDSVTFTIVFAACARLLDMETGMRVHEELLRSGFAMDGFVGSAIVDMYGKFGHLDRARAVFEQITVKSIVAWNSMIGGYALVGDSRSCFELFSRMEDEGIRPSSSTISSLLMACSRTSDLWHGKYIHGYIMRNQIEVDIFITTSLIDLYFKCGNIRYPEFIFQNTAKSNVVLWNVMISGYVKTGNLFEALEAFHIMKLYDVRPDAITFTSILSACAQLAALQQGREIHDLIRCSGFESNEVLMCALADLYAKCGAVEDARAVFNKLSVRDSVTWTSMIFAYGSNGQAFEALELFREMQKMNVKPDRVTFLALMSSCSHGGMVDEGSDIFNLMKSEYGIEPGLEHYCCLVDLLGRTGRLYDAYDIIQSMAGLKLDAGLLGSFFSACSLHGNLELGLEAARLLIDLEPNDHSTYIVLSNMYASTGRWNEVGKIRAKLREMGLKKNPGCSWIEIGKKIHQFFVEDNSHVDTELICECLNLLSIHMEDVFDSLRFFGYEL